MSVCSETYIFPNSATNALSIRPATITIRLKCLYALSYKAYRKIIVLMTRNLSCKHNHKHPYNSKRITVSKWLEKINPFQMFFFTNHVSSPVLQVCSLGKVRSPLNRLVITFVSHFPYRICKI